MPSEEFACHVKRLADGGLDCPCATEPDEPIEVQCLASYLNENEMPEKREELVTEYRRLFP